MEKELVRALREIRDEAKKGKPNPDKIFALAADALSKHTIVHDAVLADRDKKITSLENQIAKLRKIGVSK